MSDKDIGWSSAACVDVQHALDHLRLAQGIVDDLDRPEIGARLNEVIDLLDECLPAAVRSRGAGETARRR